MIEQFIIAAITIAVIAGLVSVFYNDQIYRILHNQTTKVTLIKGMPNGIPMITLYNSGIPFHFILDSGSSNCMLCMQAYKKLHIEQELDTPNTVTHGLGGDITYSRGCAAILEDDYKNKYEIIFSVSEHLDKLTTDANIEDFVIDGILGTDFMQQYSCTIDFDDMVMYKKS